MYLQDANPGIEILKIMLILNTLMHDCGLLFLGLYCKRVRLAKVIIINKV